MKRRSFLSMSAAASAALWLPRTFGAEPAAHRARHAPVFARDNGKLLILIELKGGNDGLNTVIPFADPAYYRLRKRIAIRREHAIQLDERTALHPSLEPLMPLWRSGQLAIVQGVGYAAPNLSHFRSMQIWDTASRSDQYLREGWLSRAFDSASAAAGFAAEGVVIGSAEMGPLALGGGDGARAGRTQVVEAGKGIAQLCGRPLRAQDATRLTTAFPCSRFGASIESAMQMLAARDRLRVQAQQGQALRLHAAQADTTAPATAIRLTLNGFDTHQNQPERHRLLLTQFAEGLAAMRSALVELGRWNDTLVMTYSEFGRHPRENDSAGTDHGTVAPHFMMGGRVRGGLHGVPPQLARLDGNGELPVGVDFRQLYATVLARWWRVDAQAILRQQFEPLPLLHI